MKTYVMDNSIQARKQEVDTKLVRVRKMLDEKKLNALYIAKCEGFAWITAGADSIITRYVEAGCVSALITKDKCYAITNNIEYQRFLDEEKIDQLGFELLNQLWYENKTVSYIKDIVGDGPWASDVPMPGSVDGNQLISHMQYSLLDSEIARYLYMGEVFSRELEEVLAKVRPGDVELDIVGRINNALWKHNIDTVLYLVAGDERIYKYRHCIPTNNKIKKYMMVCCNARYKGLITKITRFIHFGKPENDLLKQYADTVEIENRMIAATKIGSDNLAAYQAAVDSYEEMGYPEMWKNHHQGGPQGYTNGYYLITPDMHETVVENQCYCFNPSITGTKTEDAFIVTKDGPVMITKPISFPKIKAEINGVEIERPDILVMD